MASGKQRRAAASGPVLRCKVCQHDHPHPKFASHKLMPSGNQQLGPSSRFGFTCEKCGTYYPVALIDGLIVEDEGEEQVDGQHLHSKVAAQRPTRKPSKAAAVAVVSGKRAAATTGFAPVKKQKACRGDQGQQLAQGDEQLDPSETRLLRIALASLPPSPLPTGEQIREEYNRMAKAEGMTCRSLKDIEWMLKDLPPIQYSGARPAPAATTPRGQFKANSIGTGKTAAAARWRPGQWKNQEKKTAAKYKHCINLHKAYTSFVEEMKEITGEELWCGRSEDVFVALICKLRKAARKSPAAPARGRSRPVQDLDTGDASSELAIEFDEYESSLAGGAYGE